MEDVGRRRQQRERAEKQRTMVQRSVEIEGEENIQAKHA